MQSVICLAHVSIKSQGRENSFLAKKDRLEYMKFHWKGLEFTVLTVPQPKIFFFTQSWLPTFSKTLSYFPNNS